MTARAGRLLGLPQVAVGALLLAGPGWTLRALRAPDTAGAHRVARLLGARLVLQGTAVGLSSGTVPLRVGAWVDAAHAVSMVTVAAHGGRWRTAALASALFAAVTAAASRQLRPEPAR